jgi:hypothetical protein
MVVRIGFLFASVAFVVIVLAGSLVNAGPAASIYLPSIPFSASPTPTPTPMPTTFTDDFSNPSSGWPVTDDSVATTGYLNGEYQILIKQMNFIVRAGHSYQASDFQVQVDARDASNTNGSVGLYFGSVTNVGYYDFEVAFGQFYLGRYDLSTNTSTSIISPTTSSAILSGNATNHLKATRSGSTITLYANGTQLAQVVDSTLGFGFIGLAATSFSPNFDARFDNFALIEAAPAVVVQSSAGRSNDGVDVSPRPALPRWSNQAR